MRAKWRQENGVAPARAKEAMLRLQAVCSGQAREPRGGGEDVRAVLGTPRLCDGAVALGAIDDAGVAHGGIERHVESDGHLLDDDAGEAPKDDVRFDLEDAPSAAAAAREAVLPPQLAGLALAPRAIVAGLQQHSPVHVALRPSPRRRARAEVLRGVREGRLRRPAQPPPALPVVPVDAVLERPVFERPKAGEEDCADVSAVRGRL